MIINKITLENIRSYENQEVVFPKGSVVLSGDIGSGKTSVLLAIEFALFGLQPGQKGSALLRNGKDEGKVILELEIDGKKVVIERGLKKTKSVNQSSAFIELAGVREETSITELKNKVLELLNYPKEFAKKTNLLYRFTVYTPQEEMKQIILESSETRLDTLRHIFGIDKYKRIRENTDDFTIKLREQIRNYEGQIKDLPDTIKKLDAKFQHINFLEESLKIISEELIIRKDARLSLEKESKEIEEKIKEKEKYEQETDKTRIMLMGKNENINNFAKEKLSLERQIEEIRKQLASSQDSEKLNENIIIFREEIKKIKEQQAFKEAELKELEIKIKEKEKYEQEVDTLRLKTKIKSSAIADLEKEKERLQVQINEFKKISFNPSDIENIENELKNAENSNNLKNNTYLEILSRMNNLNSKITELGTYKKDIAKLVNCPTCFQSVPQDYKSNVLRKFEEDIFHSEKEKASLSAEKDSLLKEIDSIKQSIINFKKNINEKEKLKIKLEDIEEKEKRVQEIKNQNIAAARETDEYSKKMELASRAILMLGKCDLDFEQTKKENQALLSSEREKENMINSSQREIDRQANQKMNILEKEQRILELDIKKNEIIKDISILEITIKKIEESIFSLKKYDLIYSQNKKDLQTAIQNERQKELELASSSKEKEITLRLVEDMKKDIADKEKIKEKLIKFMEIEDFLSSSFLEMISFTERNIMLKLREEFSKLFNEWFNVLVPEIFSVRLDEDFTPVIEQQDFSLDYSFLSGGERTAIALAYRLALNQVINSLLSKIKTRDIVILDEPTDGFSEQQLDKMRDVLSQLKAEQLIIVSHESKIESFVESIIKFKKEAGITKVVAN